MKIRQGFVSNSSSSSYICTVCRETYSGWDASLRDAEMRQCEKGHTFCEAHLLGEAGPDEDEESGDLWNEEFIYETRSERCPICNLQNLTLEDELLYLRKKTGYKTSEDTLSAIKTEFSTYPDFDAWIKTK